MTLVKVMRSSNSGFDVEIEMKRPLHAMYPFGVLDQIHILLSAGVRTVSHRGFTVSVLPRQEN